LLSVLIALAATFSDSPKFTDNRVPDAALVSRAEAKVVMPKGAGALASYDRAYTQAKLEGKDYLLGQMIDHRLMQELAAHRAHDLPPPVRRVLMNEIVPAFDGGCAILTLTYQIDSPEPPKVLCNPEGPH
jgi:hypothetical protein